jgi:RNA polymerase sigma factor (sigma-70 family)
MTAVVSLSGTTLPAPPDPALLALSLAAVEPIPLPPRVPMLAFVEPPPPAVRRPTPEAALAECAAMIAKAVFRFQRAGYALGFEPDDLRQECAIAVLHALKRYDGVRPWKPFAATCVWRHLIDVVRAARGQRHPKVQLRHAEDVDEVDLAAEGDGPHDVYADAEERARFAALVATLPERTRAIVREHAVGATYDELAERHGISYVRVGQIVRGAVEGMRQKESI